MDTPLPSSKPAVAARFALRERAAPAVVRIGRGSEPVIVVHGAMADPSDLIDAAAQVRYAPADGARGGYPGVRAPTPRDYEDRILRLADPLIRAVFGLLAMRLVRVDGAFSLVTRPPDYVGVET